MLLLALRAYIGIQTRLVQHIVLLVLIAMDSDYDTCNRLFIGLPNLENNKCTWSIQLDRSLSLSLSLSRSGYTVHNIIIIIQIVLLSSSDLGRMYNLVSRIADGLGGAQEAAGDPHFQPGPGCHREMRRLCSQCENPPPPIKNAVLCYTAWGE